MASTHDDDPEHRRFRRGAGARVGPPGPPPVPGGQVVPPPREDGRLITTGSVPGWANADDPAPATPATPATAALPATPAPPSPLFGELLEGPAGAESENAWLPVDDDPGRRWGIASIIVGVFVGVVGLFVGVHAIRRSREVGLRGGLGVAGVLVSAVSILVVGAIGLSWVRYEVDVATQCALVGPGRYVTDSGTAVTCG